MLSATITFFMSPTTKKPRPRAIQSERGGPSMASRSGSICRYRMIGPAMSWQKRPT